MKSIIYLFTLFIFFNCGSEKPFSKNELVTGTWKVESISENFKNKSSEYSNLHKCNELLRHNYFSDGRLNYIMPDWKNANCELRNKDFWTGEWGIINDSTLVTRHNLHYPNGQISGYCSEQTLRFIDENTMEIVLNYQDDGIAVDDENRVGETTIFKRIKL
tara:strand:+ start:305 stop:787 length:483 start_codon:yes stop_codon:yes gene_type:complete